MTNLPNLYLDLRSDFGFKHVFAKTAHKDILIAFLNALLPEKVITDVILSPTEFKHRRESSQIFFDLSCIGENGERFIIEMQRKDQFFFRDRSVYYMSCMMVDQLTSGQSSKNYPLKEVYFIGILDFLLLDDTRKEYKQRVSLLNTLSRNIFYDKMHYIFIEIPNFDKEENELETELDKWIYLFKNLHQLKTLPEQLNQPIFQKIFTIAEINNLTKEERMLFDRNLKNQRDYEASLEYGAHVAREEALEKNKKEKLLIAKSLINDGVSINKAAEYTGIPADQLKTFKKEERILFDRGLKNQKDYEASFEYAAHEAREEGIKEGLEKGRIEEKLLLEKTHVSKEEALEKNKKEKLLIAKKLIMRGISIEEASNITGIPVEQLS